MHTVLRSLSILCLLCLLETAQAITPETLRIPTMSPSRPDSPIALLPKNPHYFLFRGKPTILVSSAEHYGAVLNLDFDYVPYLKALHTDGMNQTRLWSGVYCEDNRSFNIRDNTLAPAANRYLTPWARSETPGYANGGNKFDLTKWDAAHSRRLEDYCTQAGKQGVVVEVVLFCPFYEDSMWRLSPMNAANNVNGIGNVPRDEVYTLKHPELLAVQDAVVRHIVDTLRDVDNIYYEICNEPYFGGVTMEWQHHIADVITQAEADFPHRHLIAQNIANGSAKISKPHNAVSIFNFHYASPPDAAAANYGLNKVISFDETGFKGSDDATYRAEAWEFLMAGGGAFSNLDYSFTAAHPDGTAPVAPPTPGGGSPALRKQLGLLKRFLESLDFAAMKPLDLRSAGPQNASRYGLGAPGQAYAVYLRGKGSLQVVLELTPGSYQIDWIDPLTGGKRGTETLDHPGGSHTFDAPKDAEEIALKVIRKRG